MNQGRAKGERCCFAAIPVKELAFSNTEFGPEHCCRINRQRKLIALRTIGVTRTTGTQQQRQQQQLVSPNVREVEGIYIYMPLGNILYWKSLFGGVYVTCIKRMVESFQTLCISRFAYTHFCFPGSFYFIFSKASPNKHCEMSGTVKSQQKQKNKTWTCD